MAIHWTNRTIDHALAELSRACEPTSAEVLAFESRVHREVEARFGVGSWHERILTDAYGYSRATDKRADVHTDAVPRMGIMEVVFGMVRQPVFALATVVIVVAGVLAYRQSNDATIANRPRDPQTSSAVAVAPAALGESTEFAASVFSEALARAPLAPVASPPARVRAGVRRPAPAVHPVTGVFTTWATSVFSDDEFRVREWEGAQYVFSS